MDGAESKRISVIVPMYNVELYLPTCIESLCHQTYWNLDIILIDDGSPDHCGEISEQYAAKDPRIRVFHIKNRGLSGARNFGLQRAMEAGSEYIAFVDSDDWLEEDMFEVLLKVAESNAAEVTICSYYEEYAQCRKIITIAEKKYKNLEIVHDLIHNRVNSMVWNKLWRKELFDNIQFPQGHVYEDLAIVYRVFMKVTSAVSISKPLYHYRVSRPGSIIHAHNMSNLIDYWLAQKSRYDFFKKQKLFNKDTLFMEQLLYGCASAITRTWRWYYGISDNDKIKYDAQMKEMHHFTKQYLPLLGKPAWDLNIRFGVFCANFLNKGVFFALYYLNTLFRWVRQKSVVFR